MQILLIFIALAILAFQTAFASKILVYSPTLSKSHMISNARVADSLAKDGHDVTLLEVEFQVPIGILNASKLAKTIHVPGQFYQYIVDGVDVEMGKQVADMAFKGPSALNLLITMADFQNTMNEACEKFVLRESALFEQLKSEQFDIIIAEQLHFCGAGLAHLLAIPTHILLSSCPIQEHVASLLGLPNPSSFVPSVLDSDLPDKMSIWQRAQNIFNQFAAYSFLYQGMDPMTEIFRKHFGQDFPDLRDIIKESPFVLVNVDELVDFPRPTFANVIYIGGLMGLEGGDKSTKMQQGLKEPFKSEMAKGKKGVVFFSMGSIVSSTHLDETFRANIFQAFAQFPDYHFVVKVEKDDNFSAQIAAKLENVFLASWMPQTEILSHPRLKLFITHGGYNSLMEAARAGIPLISMGFFGDQFRNARVSERNGWGIAFDKRILLRSSKEFAESIHKILSNSKYEENAKRTQKLVLNKPFSAEERLQKSIRFLELSGGKLPELLSESRNMHPIALYNLDIVFLATTIFFAFLVALSLMARFLWRKFGKNSLRLILDGIQMNEKGKRE